MSEGAEKTSFFKRTVKTIKKNRRSKNFISIKEEEQNGSIEQKQEQNRSRTETRAEPAKKGVVLLSHIPNDFVENAMKDFFGQFGDVTNLRLVKSLKTGRPRGYAFIQFAYESVAKIVAETMNNYVLNCRLLKAKFLPNGKPFCFDEFWEKDKFGPKNCPKVLRRKATIETMNKERTLKKEKELIIGRLKRLEARTAKLKELGIDYSYKPDTTPSAVSKHGLVEPIAKKKKIMQNSVARKEDNGICSMEMEENNEKCVSEKKENEKCFVKKDDEDMFNKEEGRNEEPVKSGKKKGVVKNERNENSKIFDSPVMLIDESDKEIVFLTPPNVIKKKLADSKLFQPKTDGRKVPLITKEKLSKRQSKIKNKRIASVGQEMGKRSNPSVTRKRKNQNAWEIEGIQ